MPQRNTVLSLDLAHRFRQTDPVEWSPERLFHVIVVLGTATTTAAGCAAKSHSLPGSGGTSGSGGAGSGGGGMPATPGGGSWSINAAGSLGSGGVSLAGSSGAGGPGGEGGAAARTPCEHDQQYLCYAVDHIVECSCDENAPLSDADCPGRAFECMSYDPPTGCTCSYITGPK
jgi:hypothetical protein